MWWGRKTSSGGSPLGGNEIATHTCIRHGQIGNGHPFGLSNSNTMNYQLSDLQSVTSIIVHVIEGSLCNSACVGALCSSRLLFTRAGGRRPSAVHIVIINKTPGESASKQASSLSVYLSVAVQNMRACECILYHTDFVVDLTAAYSPFIINCRAPLHTYYNDMHRLLIDIIILLAM